MSAGTDETIDKELVKLLRAKPNNTITIFAKGDHFIFYGEDAQFVATSIFKSDVSVKMLTLKTNEAQQMKYISVNRGQYEKVVRETIILLRCSVELYANEDGEWILMKRGSPGNTVEFEQEVGVVDQAPIFAIHLGSEENNNRVTLCAWDAENFRIITSEFNDTASFLQVEQCIFGLCPTEYLFVNTDISTDRAKKLAAVFTKLEVHVKPKLAGDSLKPKSSWEDVVMCIHEDYLGKIQSQSENVKECIQLLHSNACKEYGKMEKFIICNYGARGNMKKSTNNLIDRKANMQNKLLWELRDVKEENELLKEHIKNTEKDLLMTYELLEEAIERQTSEETNNAQDLRKCANCCDSELDLEREKLAELETLEERFDDARKRTTEWLDRFDDDFGELEMVSIDKKKLSEQRNETTALAERHSHAQEHLDEMDGLIQQLVSMDVAQAAVKGANAMRQLGDSISKVQKQAKDLKNRADRINKNDVKMTAFAEAENDVKKWIETGKEKLAEFPIPITKEGVKSQLLDLDRMDKSGRGEHKKVEEVRLTARELAREASNEVDAEDMNNREKALVDAWDQLADQFDSTRDRIRTSEKLLDECQQIDKWMTAKKSMADTIGAPNTDAAVARAQFGQIQWVKEETEAKKSGLDAVNALANELVGSEGEDQSGVKYLFTKIKSLHQRWNSLKCCFDDMSEKVKKAAELGEEFRTSYKQIKNELDELELNVENASAISPKAFGEKLSKIDELKSKFGGVDKKIEKFKQLLEAADDLEVDPINKSEMNEKLELTQKKADELKRKFDNVKKAALNAQIQAVELENKLDELLAVVGNAENELKQAAPICADSAKLADETVLASAIYAKLIENEGDVSLLKTKLSDELKKKPDPKLKAKLDLLSSKWTKVAVGSRDRKDLLTRVGDLVKQFNEQESGLEQRLKGDERELASLLSKENVDAPTSSDVCDALKLVEMTMARRLADVDALSWVMGRIETSAPGPDANRLRKKTDKLADDCKKILKRARTAAAQALKKNAFLERFERLKEEVEQFSWFRQEIFISHLTFDPNRQSIEAASKNVEKVKKSLDSWQDQVQKRLDAIGKWCRDQDDTIAPKHFAALREKRKQLADEYDTVLRTVEDIRTSINDLSALLIEFSSLSSAVQSWMTGRTRLGGDIRHKSGDPQLLDEARIEANSLFDEVQREEYRLKSIGASVVRIEKGIEAMYDNIRSFSTSIPTGISVEDVNETNRRVEDDYAQLLKQCQDLIQFQNRVYSMNDEHAEQARQADEWLVSLQRDVENAERAQVPDEERLLRIEKLNRMAVGGSSKLDEAESASRRLLSELEGTNAEKDVRQRHEELAKSRRDRHRGLIDRLQQNTNSSQSRLKLLNELETKANKFGDSEAFEDLTECRQKLQRSNSKRVQDNVFVASNGSNDDNTNGQKISESNYKIAGKIELTDVRVPEKTGEVEKDVEVMGRRTDESESAMESVGMIPDVTQIDPVVEKNPMTHARVLRPKTKKSLNKAENRTTDVDSENNSLEQIPRVQDGYSYCSLCKKPVYKRIILSHIKDHFFDRTGKMTLQCSYCDYWTNAKKDIEDHVKNKHYKQKSASEQYEDHTQLYAEPLNNLAMEAFGFKLKILT